MKLLNRIMAVVSLSLAIAACKEEKYTFEPAPSKPSKVDTGYVAPEYDDDYSSMAGWDKRSEWNLANVHDPSVEKCGDYYYMYGTDASYGNAHVGHGHFLYRRSKDLVNWEFLGMAMPKTPTWIKDTLNNVRTRLGLQPIDNPVYGFWAPVVRKVGNKYRMYYSVVIDNYIKTGAANIAANFDGSWTERAFIGMMETDDLATNLWTDRGMIVSSYTDRGTNWNRPNLNDWNAYFKYNAIDPSLIVGANGENWLIYGSWHSGLVAVQLDANTGKLKTSGDVGVRIARRQNNDSNRWQGLEAPEIIYNDKTGYYYLFLAYDELSVAYNTRVCRSKSITGPYVDFAGRDITQGAECWPMITHPYKFNNHSGWVGISHAGIFQNTTTGEWYYTSQGRLPVNTNGNPYSNAIMMGHVRHIVWTEDGWPVVMPERYAAVPQFAIKESELVGKWENITLNYQFQTMQTSQEVTLADNHTVSGALTGTWSFDPAKNILTVAGVKLVVERGLDWEIFPREQTIIYAGLNSQGRSMWGKKHL